jgi:tRNA threonylcarbamoyladenosine biosynthesis protein TsaE
MPNQSNLKINFNLSEIENVSELLLSSFEGERIFLFQGTLGAGKTTFIKSLCKKLGVTDETSSPTFSIVNAYKTKSNAYIYHMDLYRVENKNDLINIGIVEYLQSGHYCFIEWPELITNEFSGVHCNLSIDENDNRILNCFKS